MDRGATHRNSGAVSSIDEGISAAAALHHSLEGTTTSSRGHASTSHTSNSHSSPCANKRQIIVQNDIMESPVSNSVNSSATATSSSGQGQGINGNSGHDSGASPHTNSSSDPDNSGESARWRKSGAHSQAWEASVSGAHVLI